MQKNKLSVKILALFLLVLTVFPMLTPLSTQAHNAYFLYVLIDDGNFTYTGSVSRDKVGKYLSNLTKRDSLLSPESAHLEAMMWNPDKLKDGSLGLGDSFLKDLDKDNNGKSSMIFTFPSKQIDDKMPNHANAEDANRAFLINNTLLPSLNTALYKLNGDKPFTSKEELYEASERLLNDQGSNGYSISYSADKNYIILTKGNEVNKLPYRLAKGYKSEKLENGKKSVLYHPEFSDDIDYITLKTIMVQGMYNAKVKNAFYKDIAELQKQSILTQKIGEFFAELSDGVRSVFGLYSMDELVYNQGLRANPMYVFGIMPSGWFSVAKIMFVICLGVALSLSGIAMVNMLLNKTLSTINVTRRLSLINGMKDLITAIFLLGGCIIFFSVIFRLNNRIVDIFYAVSPPQSALYSGAGNTGLIGSVFLGLFYLIIEVYFNFYYIFRGLMVTFLIAASPLFIISIAFGDAYKRIFYTWLRELVSNVFIQSFHAIILALFLRLQGNSRPIEILVVSFALIPMTRFLQSLMIGTDGNLTEQLSGKLAGSSIAFTGGAIGGAIGGLAGGKLGGLGSALSRGSNKLAGSVGNSANISSGLGSSATGGTSVGYGQANSSGANPSDSINPNSAGDVATDKSSGSVGSVINPNNAGSGLGGSATNPTSNLNSTKSGASGTSNSGSGGLSAGLGTAVGVIAGMSKAGSNPMSANPKSNNSTLGSSVGGSPRSANPTSSSISDNSVGGDSTFEPTSNSTSPTFRERLSSVKEHGGKVIGDIKDNRVVGGIGRVAGSVASDIGRATITAGTGMAALATYSALHENNSITRMTGGVGKRLVGRNPQKVDYGSGVTYDPSKPESRFNQNIDRVVEDEYKSNPSAFNMSGEELKDLQNEQNATAETAENRRNYEIKQDRKNARKTRHRKGEDQAFIDENYLDNN